MTRRLALAFFGKSIGDAACEVPTDGAVARVIPVSTGSAARLEIFRIDARFEKDIAHPTYEDLPEVQIIGVHCDEKGFEFWRRSRG